MAQRPVIAVEQLVVPASVDDDDAQDFIDNVDIHARAEAEKYGHDELRLTPAEVLLWWQDPASPRALFGVKVDGELVGRAMYNRRVTDPTTCWVAIDVVPEFRGRGIGSAIAERLQQFARSEGRSKMIGYVVSAPSIGGTRIDAPTGFGSLPADTDEARFLQKHGYRLEQVVRASRLVLPVDVAVEPPADYRVHHWVNTTPPQWLEQMALLYTRMSTDAPSAGLETPEDPWTVERVIDEDRATAAGPRPYLIAVVEHVPTGQLAGYTTLAVPAEVERPVHQHDTLVLREHRGNRLGMLLKVANIDQLQQRYPWHPSIITFNAEENRYMLDVNEAVGFVPFAYEGAWLKKL